MSNFHQENYRDVQKEAQFNFEEKIPNSAADNATLYCNVSLVYELKS